MRYLIYSPDTYGLGHVRRCLHIAKALVDNDRDAQVLLVSGSPRAGSFGLPERIDIVRLPSVTKNSAGGYRPRTLGGTLASTIRLRSGLISAAAEAFEPDVVLVDHIPTGVHEELAPLAERASFPFVLGMRDVVDDVSRVRASWDAAATWDVIDARYREILVYGDEHVLTTAQELNLADRIRPQVRHVGYVTGPPVTDAATRSPRPSVLVTTGGGGDGWPSTDRFLTYLETHRPEVDVSIVTGPLMSGRRTSDLMSRADRLPTVSVATFDARLAARLPTFWGVVAMAGYNTSVEIATAGRPALLIPRTHPRLEQSIRASRLVEFAPFTVRTLDELSDHAVEVWLRSLTQADPIPYPSLNFDGARTTADRLISIATDPQVPSERKVLVR